MDTKTDYEYPFAMITSTKKDAALVIERLSERVRQYGFASVADLNDLIGVTSRYVDEKWGWTNLTGIVPTRCTPGRGWTLDLPKPLPR